MKKKTLINNIEKGFSQEGTTEKKIPIVIKWKGVEMVRSHSFMATVREIVEVTKTLDLVKIGIVGNQSTGKSTLAESIAHLIHKISEIPFTVRIFDKEALLDFQNTLAGLTPANYVLVFDDVSFLGAQATKKQIDLIKQAITVIRHLPGGQDVKIVIIMNYHYTLGLDKYLRQADFRYFTSVGSSEIDNMEKIVGNENMKKVLSFQKMYTKMLVSKHFDFRIAPKPRPPFVYKHKIPFIPVMFYNNDTLRIIVTPRRQWINPLCSICDNAKGGAITQIDLKQFMLETEKKFSPDTVKTAVKQVLLINGMNVYGQTVRQCRKYLDQALEKKIFNIQDFAAYYGFEVKNTRLMRKLDGVLIDDTTTNQTLN